LARASGTFGEDFSVRSFLRKALNCIDDRTGFESAVRHFLRESIPASTGWRHVFGSVALFLFVLQGVTGILLTFNYAPTPGDAYSSLQYIMTELPAGRIIRGLHHWGASIMIVAVVLHLLQVALYGAYKKPREATWVFGVVLLLLVLGFGLTGYLLPWDNRAYWATVVTTEIAGLTPGLGPSLQRLLGSEDGIIGVTAFARFYGLHVTLLPLLTTFIIAVHLYLVRKHGVMPAPGDQAPKIRFYPTQAFRDTVSIFVVFVALFVMAVAVDAPLDKLADPTDRSYVPRPDWYFLFLFQLLKFFPGSWEAAGAIVFPMLAIVALLLVPLLDRKRMTALRNRTMTLGVLGLILLGWASLTVTAVMTTPNQPVVSSGTPRRDSGWARLSPSQLSGLAYFRQKTCTNCHNLLSGEPKVGPTLATLPIRSATATQDHFKRLTAGGLEGTKAGLQIDEQQGAALAEFASSLTPENAWTLESAPNEVIEGARVYQENHCSMCHQINGDGMTIGPPLNGIGTRRTSDWLKEKIQDPRVTSPDTKMPPFRIPSAELDQLVGYLMAVP